MAELTRVESAVAERKLAVVAALADDRLGEQCDAEQIGRWDADGLEIAESEVSAALTVARHHAGRLISLGLSLRDRLPQVRAALAAGQLDVYRATVIDTATRNVTDELIAEVEHRILEKALAPAIVGGRVDRSTPDKRVRPHHRGRRSRRSPRAPPPSTPRPPHRGCPRPKTP